MYGALRRCSVGSISPSTRSFSPPPALISRSDELPAIWFGCGAQADSGNDRTSFCSASTSKLIGSRQNGVLSRMAGSFRRRAQACSSAWRKSPKLGISSVSAARSTSVSSGFQMSKISTTRIASLRFQASCS